MNQFKSKITGSSLFVGVLTLLAAPSVLAAGHPPVLTPETLSSGLALAAVAVGLVIVKKVMTKSK